MLVICLVLFCLCFSYYYLDIMLRTIIPAPPCAGLTEKRLKWGGERNARCDKAEVWRGGEGKGRRRKGRRDVSGERR